MQLFCIPAGLWARGAGRQQEDVTADGAGGAGGPADAAVQRRAGRSAVVRSPQHTEQCSGKMDEMIEQVTPT